MKRYLLLLLLVFPFPAFASYHVFTCADAASMSSFSAQPTCSGSGASSVWTFTNSSESIGDFSGGTVYPITSGVTYYYTGIVSGTGSICVINNNGGHQLESAGTFIDVGLSSTNGNRGSGLDNRGGSSQCGSGSNLNGTIQSWCVSDGTGQCPTTAPAPPAPATGFNEVFGSATSTASSTIAIVDIPNLDYFMGVITFLMVMFGMVYLFKLT